MHNKKKKINQKGSFSKINLKTMVFSCRSNYQPDVVYSIYNRIEPEKYILGLAYEFHI